MSEIILQLKDIVKDYAVAGDAVHALKGMNLSFRRNEFVSVLGPSGCGKTTLLNIIGGLDRYTSGDLVIKGVSTKEFRDGDWDAYRNESIGFVFQSYNLISHQTVLENVALALTLSGVGREERIRRAKEALDKVGLKDHYNKKPNQLSGGQCQRVAIARALVNNPEILLADEPTGALDSRTSVQIMELIKEISHDRLVIMVTHNPELAYQYSTRIIELKDGELCGDSNPPEGIPRAAEQAEKQKARSKGKKHMTAMSFGSAFALSGKNLLTKKGRTAVTSFAGSIGIISVCLVLAFSSGFSAYITRTEEDMLSYYPLEIQEVSLNSDAIMSGLQSSEEMPDLSELDDRAYANSFLTQIAKGMTVSNDIAQERFVDYLYAMDKEWYGAISTDTGVSVKDNLFTSVVVGHEDDDPTNDPDISTKIMSLTDLTSYFKEEVTRIDSEKYGDIVDLVDYFGSPVHTMPGTSEFSKDNDTYVDYILSQYDIISEGGYFPEQPDQAVIVIGANNDITDILLAELGYISDEQFIDPFNMGEDKADEWMSLAFDELTSKPFTLYYNDAVYTRNENYGFVTGKQYPFVYNGERENLSADEDEGVQIKITAVLRLKDDLSYGCLSGGLNLTEQLLEQYIAVNSHSDIVTWMKTDFSDGGGKLTVMGADMQASTLCFAPAEGVGDSCFSRMNAQTAAALAQVLAQQYPTFSEKLISTYLQTTYITTSYGADSVLRLLGDDLPASSVYIYPSGFDAKDAICDYIDGWTQSSSAPKDATEIRYTDTVGLMMVTVQTMLDAITYVLVAFTAISLVVSTVMIGVITYVSVIERTKEIGILRAIGARKKDIRRVFNAETFIVGLTAGLLGAGIAYLLQLIINAILTPLTGLQVDKPVKVTWCKAAMYGSKRCRTQTYGRGPIIISAIPPPRVPDGGGGKILFVYSEDRLLGSAADRAK